jgi:hypothetical protein
MNGGSSKDNIIDKHNNQLLMRTDEETTKCIDPLSRTDIIRLIINAFDDGICREEYNNQL